MVKQKASNRLSWLEDKWKPILDTFEVSTLRRGRTLEKQGQVTQIHVAEGRVTAEIQGSKIRTQSYRCTVSFDCMDWKEDALTDLARRLYLRPDFLAALFAGEWETDFWDSLEHEGIRWFPDEEGAKTWLRSLHCSCTESLMPCAHAAAVIYALLHRVENHPVGMLQFIGIEDKELMDAVHRIGAKNHFDTKSLLEEEKARQIDTTSRDTELTSAEASSVCQLFSVWLEERSVFESNQTKPDLSLERLHHRIRPHWDESKLQALEKRLLFRVKSSKE